VLPAAARAAGRLLVWGSADGGALGMRLAELPGARPSVESPVLQGEHWSRAHGGVVQVVCRAQRTLALCADGAVFSWGSCKNLSLGHGDKVERALFPRRLEALDGIRIVALDAAETSCAAVSDEGELFTWGWGGSYWGGSGGLGHGDTATQPRPAIVEALQGVRVASVSVGAQHMLALSAEGRAYSWGHGEFGRLGNGKGVQPKPEPVQLLDDLRSQAEAKAAGAAAGAAAGGGGRVVQVAAGHTHSLAVLADGRLLAWGKNEASQLGLGGALVMDLNTSEAYPTLVELEAAAGEDAEGAGAAAARFNGRVARVAAGNNHTVCLTRDGDVFQWGGRLFIQPTHIPLATISAKALAADAAEHRSAPAAGADATATAAAAAAAAGSASAAPKGTVALRGAEIAAGEGSSAVIDADGRLFVWGKFLSQGVLGETCARSHACARPIYLSGPRLTARPRRAPSAGLGGQLGMLPRLGVRQPTCVERLLSAEAGPVRVAKVSLGQNHAAAITGLPSTL
jgi:E3 ubiquitin-protein ligase HERC2